MPESGSAFTSSEGTDSSDSSRLNTIKEDSDATGYTPPPKKFSKPWFALKYRQMRQRVDRELVSNKQKCKERQRIEGSLI